MKKNSIAAEQFSKSRLSANKKGATTLVAAILCITLGAVSVTASAHSRQERQQQHAEQMVERISEKLDLNEQQQAQLQVLKNAVLQAKQQVREQSGDVRDEISQLFDQPQLDRQKMLNLVQLKANVITEQAPSVIDALGDFYDNLSPAQQQEARIHLQHMIEQGPRHHRGSRWHGVKDQ
jgi:Spy/CpxP family protein refolding chaperone